MLPLLILTPHASGHVPADVLEQMLGEAHFDSKARANFLAHLFSEGDPSQDDKIEALHQAFCAFATDALTLFEDTITSEVQL